jgi:hypothetical protein
MKGIIASGAAANSAMYPRWTFTLVGEMIAARASTTPVIDIAVPNTVPRATPLRSSKFSATPRATSSNSIPVKTMAIRNTDMRRPAAAPTT